MTLAPNAALVGTHTRHIFPISQRINTHRFAGDGTSRFGFCALPGASAATSVVIAFATVPAPSTTATGRLRPAGDTVPLLPFVKPHVTRDFTSLYFFGRTALLFASILFITASHLFGTVVVLRVAAPEPVAAAAAVVDRLTALAVGDGTMPTASDDDVVEAVDAGRLFS